MESEDQKMRQNPGAQQGNINMDRDSGQEALGSNQDLESVDRQSETPEEDELPIDSGGVATAAFDEGDEPRGADAGKNRGITQGSDDSASA